MDLKDIEVTVPSVSEWFTLRFFGDQHVGAEASHRKLMLKVINEIKADPEYTRAILMGDPCDCIIPSDKKWGGVMALDPRLRDHLDNIPNMQKKFFVDDVEPIKDQLWFALRGNHDNWMPSRHSNDISLEICKELGVELLSQVVQMRIRVKDLKGRSYRVRGVVSHAEKGSITPQGKRAAVGKLAEQYPNVDFFALAHTHGYLAEEEPYNDVVGSWGNPRYVDKKKWLFLTGGFLKNYGLGYTTYSERKGYAPVKLGSPYIRMRQERTSVASGTHGGKSVDKTVLEGF